MAQGAIRPELYIKIAIVIPGGFIAVTMLQDDLKSEVKNPVEPAMSIEKKLIGWSLGTGLALLAILLLPSHFFPAA